MTICCFAAFAHYWLMPRLSSFRQRHPDVQVDLLIDFLASPASSQLRKEQADLIISHGVIKPEGVVARRIFNDVVVPVCSPSYLENHGPLSDPFKLKDTTLLHSGYRPNDWGEWFSSLGVEFDRKPGLLFSGSSLLYQAAKEGIGVALGQYHLLEKEIESGGLVVPLDHRLERAAGYFLLHSKHAHHDAKIIELRDWIMHEAQSKPPVKQPIKLDRHEGLFSCVLISLPRRTPSAPVRWTR